MYFSETYVAYTISKPEFTVCGMTIIVNSCDFYCWIRCDGLWEPMLGNNDTHLVRNALAIGVKSKILHGLIKVWLFLYVKYGPISWSLTPG